MREFYDTNLCSKRNFKALLYTIKRLIKDSATKLQCVAQKNVFKAEIFLTLNKTLT